MAVFKQFLLFSFLCILSSAPKANVISLDLCTDHWVLWFIKPEYIAGLSHLSKNPRLSALSHAAKKHPTHTGDPEEITHLNGTHILVDSYLHPFKKNMLEKLGYKVIVLPSLQTPLDLQKRLALLKKELPPHFFKEIEPLPAPSTSNHSPPKTAFLITSSGDLAGKNTPGDLLLSKLGLKNAARHTGHHPNCAEELLTRSADLILISESAQCPHKKITYIKKLLARTPKKVVTLPQKVLLCPGPWHRKTLEEINTLNQLG